jgi:hypothetical protein
MGSVFVVWVLRNNLERVGKSTLFLGPPWCYSDERSCCATMMRVAVATASEVSWNCSELSVPSTTRKCAYWAHPTQSLDKHAAFSFFR